MDTVFAYLMSATSDPPVGSTYSQDLMTAVAAAAALFAVLLVVYLVIRATYLVIKLFTDAALVLTTGAFAIVVLIGWLNR